MRLKNKAEEDLAVLIVNLYQLINLIMAEIIDENERETLVEVPTPHNKQENPDKKNEIYMKINNDEWRKCHKIQEEGDRVVVRCNNPDKISSTIKVVRRDIFETWQKEAREIK